MGYEWAMRIVVAEDQLLLREGLLAVLAAHGHEVVAAVGTGPDAVAATLQHAPDLALLDIRMPPTHRDEGIVAARTVRSERSGQPVLLLSQYVEQLYVDELLGDGAGGVGYLLKDRVFDGAQFMAHVDTVAAGGTVVDPEVITRLLQRRKHAEVLDRLTPREREVLAQMARGDSNSAIATRLVVTEKAVQKHINSLLAKLDLPADGTGARRVQAVLAYLRA